MVELKKAGYTIGNPKHTPAEIANSNNASAMNVYEVIKTLADKHDPFPTKHKPASNNSTRSFYNRKYFHRFVSSA